MKTNLKIFLLKLITFCRKRTILIETGDNVFDNGFVFAKYLGENEINFCKKYKIFVVEKKINKDAFLPKNIKRFRWKNNKISILLFDFLSYRAKFLIFCYDNLWKYSVLRDDAKLVYINHGAFPVKNVSEYYDLLFANNKKYRFLCCTSFVSDLIEKKYRISNVEYFVSGMPRLDLINFKKTNIRELFGIDRLGSVILIACTFRNFYNDKSSFFSDEFPLKFTNDEIKKLNDQLCKANKFIIFKLHHAQMCAVSNVYYSNIIFVDNNRLKSMSLTTFDLFNMSDSLITDYSSIYFDYLCLNKPLAFIISDDKDYKNINGFSLENYKDYMPGFMIKNKVDFFSYVFSGNYYDNLFEKDRLEIKELFVGRYENNCRSVLEAIIKL